MEFKKNATSFVVYRVLGLISGLHFVYGAIGTFGFIFAGIVNESFSSSVFIGIATGISSLVIAGVLYQTREEMKEPHS